MLFVHKYYVQGLIIMSDLSYHINTMCNIHIIYHINNCTSAVYSLHPRLVFSSTYFLHLYILLRKSLEQE